MAAEKFSFWKSFYESLKELPPEDFKEVICAMCERAFYDNDVELYGHLKALFTLIKPSIEKSISLSEIRSEVGKQGGRPKKKKANQSNDNQIKANESNSKPTKTETKTMTMTYDKEELETIDNSEHSPSSNRKTSFQIPSIAEITTYCTERHNNISPEMFFDYYSSNGWKVGSGTMKDWKAAIRLWEHREKNNDNMNQNHMLANHYTSKDFAKLEEQLLEN